MAPVPGAATRGTAVMGAPIKYSRLSKYDEQQLQTAMEIIEHWAAVTEPGRRIRDRAALSGSLGDVANAIAVILIWARKSG